MARLQLQDSVQDIVMKMSDCVPGAIRVLMQIIERDFDNVPGPMLVLLLDEYKVYGSDIWMLYKDRCDSDLDIMNRAIRARQVGYITENEFNSMQKFTSLPSVEDMLHARKI